MMSTVMKTGIGIMSGTKTTSQVKVMTRKKKMMNTMEEGVRLDRPGEGPMGHQIEVPTDRHVVHHMVHPVALLAEAVVGLTILLLVPVLPNGDRNAKKPTLSRCRRFHGVRILPVGSETCYMQSRTLQRLTITLRLLGLSQRGLLERLLRHCRRT